MAGQQLADGLITPFNSYKDFIHSLNNLDFSPEASVSDNLGLTEFMAKKILIAYGLTWFESGWTGSPTQLINEYLFPQAKNLWNDLNRPKDTSDHVSVVSFVAAFRRIYQHSGMIHLMFDPNEIFAEGQPWYPKLPEFIAKGLVREVGEKLYWNYPGDIMQPLGEYQYFSYEFFKDLLDRQVKYLYWSQKDGKLIEVNSYSRLGLPSDFRLETYVDTILALFDAAQST